MNDWQAKVSIQARSTAVTESLAAIQEKLIGDLTAIDDCEQIIGGASKVIKRDEFLIEALGKKSDVLGDAIWQMMQAIENIRMIDMRIDDLTWKRSTPEVLRLFNQISEQLALIKSDERDKHTAIARKRQLLNQLATVTSECNTWI